MSDETAVSPFFTDLKRELQDLRQTLTDGWRQFAMTTRNGIRQAQSAKLDYVVLNLGGELPERDEPPRSFIQRQLPLPPPPLSMETLNRRLRAIADANNVKGIVFIFTGFRTGLATLQNVRRAIQRVQEAGKAIVVFTPYLDMAHYAVAAVADRIVIPPSASFDALGLRTEAIFLKDALARIGVGVEAIQISPYKTAANTFSQADMTPEHREQLTLLLDERFDLLTSAMAEGRGKTQAEIQTLIDQAPYPAEKALELGLVDDVAYEDELAALLGEKTETETETEEEKKARLLVWQKARPLLFERPYRQPRQFIGVVSLEGMIVSGSSRQPPAIPLPFVGGATAGSDTLLRLLRQAEKMDNMAALILHVDSVGGSALASDLIAREIKRIGQKKPILAYMGNVAASGGYQVSIPARRIMSQSGTITGSIGVLMMRMHTQALYQNLSVNRASLQRGQRAGLYSDEAPLTADETAVLRQSIEEVYVHFKRMVADGRSLPFDDLDPICEGRVWSGRQALAHKLVDSHGDFEDAIRQAAELAKLPIGPNDAIHVLNLYPKGQSYRLPQPFEPSELTETISQLLSGERWRDMSGRPLLLMPFEVKFK